MAFACPLSTAPSSPPSAPWPLYQPACQSSGRYDIMALPFPFVRAFDDEGAAEGAADEARLAASLDPAVARGALRAFRNYGAENGTIRLNEDVVLVVSGAERGHVWQLMDVSYGTKVTPLGEVEGVPLAMAAGPPQNDGPIDFERYVELVLIPHLQSRSAE
jgi:hypothetical protein